jgi:DNA-binding transcriptional regulator YiaG
MSEKTAPLGVCDLCGEDFPSNVPLYTTKGNPRRYCSRECRNTANSRAGASIRSDKAKSRVQRGEWENPSPLVREDATQEEIDAWRERMAAGVSDARQREVEEGTWRNPALDNEARAKLSRPRKHSDDPVLHSALEKLGAGASVSDLTPEERDAHRAYRRQLRQARPDESRAYYRQRYRQEMATESGRGRQREKWRRQREQLEQREPNHRLVAAREGAGLSQADLADLAGVSQAAVSKWERFGVVPRSSTVRQRVEELLGKVW